MLLQASDAKTRRQAFYANFPLGNGIGCQLRLSFACKSRKLSSSCNMENKQRNKLLFLWTCPRSCSSAFERSVMTLSYVRSPITEPFMDAFYFGPQRQSRRFESGDWTEPNASYEAIAKALTAQATTGDGNTVTFVKDMAFGMEGRFDILEEWFSNAKHSFLIRDPTKAIPSFYRMFTEPEIVISGCVCFDPTETGYRQLYEMYEFVKDKLDSNPVVIDADDLLESPKQIMKAYCDGVGIKYDDCMTSWQAGEAPQSWISRPQWSLKWRQSAVDSSGFLKPRSVADETYPADVMKAIEESRPFYEKLYSARIRLR